MPRLRLIGALCCAALLIAACSDDGGETAPDGDTSSLDSGVNAPPVPKSLDGVTTTTAANAPAPTSTTTAVPPGLWLSPTGDDAAAGTYNAPWKTLNAAAAKLKPGDTLTITPGTYAENVGDAAWRIANLNGTADKWITIKAAPGARPVISGGQWKTIAIESSSYLELRGLEIVGTATTDKQPTTGVEIRASHHLRIADNFVHDGGGGGIGANASNHIDITGNYISGMGKWNPFQTSGIATFELAMIGGGPDADGYSMRIVGNVVYGTENLVPPTDGSSKVVTDGNCIIIDSHDPAVYTGVTYVANNVCSNNGGRGIHVFKAGNVVAVNNTLFHNTQTAVLKDKGGELSAVSASNVVFRNNLVITRDGRKATHLAGAKNVEFDSNLFQEASSTDVGSANTIVPDPGLTDPADGDFSLKPGSPAIDAGSADGAPTTDQKGVTRRGKPDIGAFEAAS